MIFKLFLVLHYRHRSSLKKKKHLCPSHMQFQTLKSMKNHLQPSFRKQYNKQLYLKIFTNNRFIKTFMGKTNNIFSSEEILYITVSRYMHFTFLRKEKKLK